MHGATKKIRSIFTKAYKDKKAVKNAAKKPTAELFGIAGSGRGVGVTHFSILLANYLTGVKNKKTAVLEWNQNGDFERIEKITFKKSATRRVSQTFKILEVSYIKQAGTKELLECINHGFDTVVIDFGSDFKNNREEFLRCDRKILMGSYSEWRVGAFTDLIAQKKSEEGRWEFLAAFGSEEAAKEMRQCMHAFVGRVPESSDAFAVTGEIMAFFEGFLKY